MNPSSSAPTQSIGSPATGSNSPGFGTTTQTTSTAPGQPITPGPALADDQVNLGTRDNPNIKTFDPSDLGENKLITTAGPAETAYAEANSNLNDYISNLNAAQNITPGTYSDPYTQQLDQISRTGDAATKSLIAGITASYTNNQNTINDKFDRYTKGMEALGVANGESQFTPQQLQGQQAQALNDHMSKLQTLQAEETKAVADAQNAQSTKDMATVKDKMDYVKSIQTQKLSALKDMYDAINTSETKNQSAATFYAPSILAEISGKSSAEKEAIIQGVAAKTGIPADYLAAATATAQQKAAKSTAKGSTGGLKSIISNVSSILNNTTKNASGYSIRGDDGYVDPNAYIQAYQQFLKAGYTDKQWQTNFPAKDYVNPQSYSLLPTNLQPTKTKTTRGS